MILRWLVIVVVVLVVLRAVRLIRARRPAPSVEWDPWAVLGVQRGAPRDAIAHAYREQLKKYHPDRVAHLGAELQQVAHRKTVDLQRAYRELVG